MALPVTQLPSPTAQLPESCPTLFYLFYYPDFSLNDRVSSQIEIQFSPMTRRPSCPQSTTGQTQAPFQQPISAHSQTPPPQAPPSSQTQPQPQLQTQLPQPSYLLTRRRYPLNITFDIHYSQSFNILLLLQSCQIHQYTCRDYSCI